MVCRGSEGADRGFEAGAAVLIRIRAQASEPFADVQLLVQDSVWGMGDGLSEGSINQMGMGDGNGDDDGAWKQSINQSGQCNSCASCMHGAEQSRTAHGMAWRVLELLLGLAC